MRIVALLAAGAALAACGGSSSSSSVASSSATASATASASATTATTSSGPPIGFEGMPIEVGPPLASPATTDTGKVDGISCAPVEQLVYHIHAHLAVYVNGSLRSLPAGIGIPGSHQIPYYGGIVALGGHCYYWLHTHTNDGVIHIESPAERVYTLGEFFDEWHQPLSSTQVATARGRVTALVDGRRWSHSPRLIPLLPHLDIQLDVGVPVVPFQPVSWAQTYL